MNEWVFGSYASSRTHFPLLSCLVQLRCVGFAFFLLYFILTCFATLLETCSSLMRDREGVDSERRGGREELRGIEGEETEIKIHCIRKDSIFKKR